MVDQTIIVARCGCQYKAVPDSPAYETASLELTTICVVHSQARTAYLGAKANQLECGCDKSHTHSRSKAGYCIELGCTVCMVGFVDKRE